MHFVKRKLDHFQRVKKFSGPSAPEFIITDQWSCQLSPVPEHHPPQVLGGSIDPPPKIENPLPTPSIEGCCKTGRLRFGGVLHPSYIRLTSVLHPSYIRLTSVLHPSYMRLTCVLDYVRRGVLENLRRGVLENLRRGVLDYLRRGVLDYLRRGVLDYLRRGVLEYLRRGLLH